VERTPKPHRVKYPAPGHEETQYRCGPPWGRRVSPGIVLFCCRRGRRRSQGTHAALAAGGSSRVILPFRGPYLQLKGLPTESPLQRPACPFLCMGTTRNGRTYFSPRDHRCQDFRLRQGCGETSRCDTVVRLRIGPPATHYPPGSISDPSPIRLHTVPL